VHPESPHAGGLFVQGTIDGRLFDDVHGAGWRLVSCGLDAGASSVLTGDLGEWFGAIGGKVVIVDRSDPVFGRWFDEHGTSWALQRPDFFLYGTATDATGARRLLTDLRSHLLDPTLEGTPT
jgi:3-(3-hydroxy-phenyl)propionate hydroxylase